MQIEVKYNIKEKVVFEVERHLFTASGDDSGKSVSSETFPLAVLEKRDDAVALVQSLQKRDIEYFTNRLQKNPIFAKINHE